MRAVIGTGEDVPDDLADAEFNALSALADTLAVTPAGLAAQLRASFELFGDLRFKGNPEDPNAFHFGDWKDETDGRMLRSLLEGAERLSAQDHGGPVGYVRPEHRDWRELRLKNAAGALPADERKILAQFLDTLRDEGRSAAMDYYNDATASMDYMSKYRIWQAVGRASELVA